MIYKIAVLHRLYDYPFFITKYGNYTTVKWIIRSTLDEVTNFIVREVVRHFPEQDRKFLTIANVRELMGTFRVHAWEAGAHYAVMITDTEYPKRAAYRLLQDATLLVATSKHVPSNTVRSYC